MSIEKITLGGGCFWCVEAVLQDLKGVHNVKSGYSGGHVDNPTYRQVTTGKTGHAEVVQVEFDSTVISLQKLLKIFFTFHDPTTPNQQGNDIGPQYRSIILYHNEEQKIISNKVINDIEEEKIWENKKIVTEVTEFKKFFSAEDYHQNYYRNNMNQPYCRVIIEPKVRKLHKKYLEQLK